MIKTHKKWLKSIQLFQISKKREPSSGRNQISEKSRNCYSKPVWFGPMPVWHRPKSDSGWALPIKNIIFIFLLCKFYIIVHISRHANCYDLSGVSSLLKPKSAAVDKVVKTPVLRKCSRKIVLSLLGLYKCKLNFNFN